VQPEILSAINFNNTEFQDVIQCSLKDTLEEIAATIFRVDDWKATGSSNTWAPTKPHISVWFSRYTRHSSSSNNFMWLYIAAFGLQAGGRETDMSYSQSYTHSHLTFFKIFFWPCSFVYFWRVTNLTYSFFYNMFIWILYMFWATLCSSSGGQLY